MLHFEKSFYNNQIVNLKSRFIFSYNNFQFAKDILKSIEIRGLKKRFLYYFESLSHKQHYKN